MGRALLVKNISKIIGMRNINRLRQIKWFVLNLFIKDTSQIKKFYQNEIDLKILVKILPEIIDDGDCVFDIGANIGGYSYYITRTIYNKNCLCYAFEPRSNIFKNLTNNIKAKNFIAVNLALSDKSGTADLYLPPSHGQSSLVYFDHFEGVKKEKISLMTLDEYVGKKHIKNVKLIKIDVEGHEFEVIEGAKETIKINMPVILCESENRHLKPQNKSTEEFLSVLESIGYKSFVISKKENKIMEIHEVSIPKEEDNNNEYFYNYWFIPNEYVPKYLKFINNILSNNL